MQKGPDRFCSKSQEILILLSNLNVSKRPYPSHALSRSVCLGQGCRRRAPPAGQLAPIVNPRARQLVHTEAPSGSSELSYKASVASPSPAKVFPCWPPPPSPKESSWKVKQSGDFPEIPEGGVGWEGQWGHLQDRAPKKIRYRCDILGAVLCAFSLARRIVNKLVIFWARVSLVFFFR